METKYHGSERGWVSQIYYKQVNCFRDWGEVKPTKKQVRKFMKRLRQKI